MTGHLRSLAFVRNKAYASAPERAGHRRIAADAVHTPEPQGGPGRRRVKLRRRPGPGVPPGDRCARTREVRPELPERPAYEPLARGCNPRRCVARNSRRVDSSARARHRAVLDYMPT